MKVQKYTVENSSNRNLDRQRIKAPVVYHTTPSFKGGPMPLDGILNIFGGAMQWIQDKGFLASFLIQDVLGMTAPRVYAAFLRDKEVTGKYNIQEGFEVLGREGLTGPCMMAVAPAMFCLAARFGKTTNVNSRLINRFGDSLKEIVSSQNFDKTILKNKQKFKDVFFKTNIEKILGNTFGENNVKKENIDFILDRIQKYETSKGKTRSKYLEEIVEYIDNIKFNTSTELESLNKVKVGSNGNAMNFSAREAFEAMVKYSDDAIKFNKHLEELDAIAAENIKDAAIAKRFLANAATVAATLGIMGVLPKIYARSNTSPGAVTAQQMREQENKENSLKAVSQESDNNTDKADKTDEIENSKNQVSFKGKNSSALSYFGKIISKFTNDKLASELEYNGHNFTNTLMAGLSLFGLLAPRGMRAYNRAQVDENGKKDLTELYEILIRDIASSLSVVFFVPMVTRAFVSSYEKASGFVLMNKDRSLTGFKKVLDLLNPYSSSQVLSNTELNSLYNGVNNQEKMINFCKFIDKNNGDIQKILSKTDEFSHILKENAFDIESLKELPKADRNNKLLKFFENLGKDGKLGKVEIDAKIARMMKNTKNANANKIASFAKGLNSIPAVILTFLVSPYILGWVIPRLTYARTRKMHQEANERRKAEAKVA